jgi:hypothetical protein
MNKKGRWGFYRITSEAQNKDGEEQQAYNI